MEPRIRTSSYFIVDLYRLLRDTAEQFVNLCGYDYLVCSEEQGGASIDGWREKSSPGYWSFEFQRNKRGFFLWGFGRCMSVEYIGS